MLFKNFPPFLKKIPFALLLAFSAFSLPVNLRSAPQSKKRGGKKRAFPARIASLLRCRAAAEMRWISSSSSSSAALNTSPPLFSELPTEISPVRFKGERKYLPEKIGRKVLLQVTSIWEGAVNFLLNPSSSLPLDKWSAPLPHLFFAT